MKFLDADRVRSRPHFHFMGGIADSREQACTIPAAGLCRAGVPPIRFLAGQMEGDGPAGNQVGTSEISRVSEGCAIREQWTSASGQGGTSINYYDADDHQWHQDWVGGDGTILHLRGGLKAGAMVLSGESTSPKGVVINRITWTQLPDGKVTQQWETSTDTGTSWKTSFVGTYEKQP